MKTFLSNSRGVTLPSRVDLSERFSMRKTLTPLTEQRAVNRARACLVRVLPARLAKVFIWRTVDPARQGILLVELTF